MLSGLGVRDMSAVLKLVTQKQFSEQVDVDLESSSRNGHSLQTPLSYLSPWQPAVLRHVTERFSVKGQTVLDLTCAAGATGVECASQGRHFIGCTNEYALAKLARARLNPADIAEVVLRLQFINLKRPVDIRGFQEPFSNFFDIDTYRELLSLKLALRGSQDRVGHFIQFVVASIIHGHTVGHLSAYTSPQAAITPGAQATLNGKRGEVPSYRAVGARVIKKAAMLLRDGIPSGLQDDSIERSLYCAEPNNIIDVGTGKVDLALLCPEQPGAVQQGLRSWLRSWWLGMDLPEQRPEIASIPAWQEHISEVLLETARVVRRGGRAVIRTGNGRLGTKVVNYKEQLAQVLDACLPTYWQVEGTIIEQHVKSSGLIKGASDRPYSSGAGELVVLRRK